MFGLFEDQKRKRIYYHNMVRRAIFCYPSKLPYFDQKGVPLPPRGVRGGGNLTMHGISVHRPFI